MFIDFTFWLKSINILDFNEQKKIQFNTKQNKTKKKWSKKCDKKNCRKRERARKWKKIFFWKFNIRPPTEAEMTLFNIWNLILLGKKKTISVIIVDSDSEILVSRINIIIIIIDCTFQAVGIRKEKKRKKKIFRSRLDFVFFSHSVLDWKQPTGVYIGRFVFGYKRHHCFGDNNNSVCMFDAV